MTPSSLPFSGGSCRRWPIPAFVTLPLLSWSLWSAAGAASPNAATLRGTVVSASSTQPIPDAVVELLPDERRTTTDAQGQFRFEGLREGLYELRIRHLGYRTLALAVEVGDRETVDIGTIALESAPATLEPVVVAGNPVSPRLASTGFYNRRDVGAGVFLERDQIERWTPREVSDVLRHIPGVRVQPNPNYGRSLPPPRSALGYAIGSSPGRDLRRLLIYSPRAPNGAQCPPLYFVDGTFAGDAGALDVDTRLDVTAIEAVEFYAGAARVPSQFNRPGAACGVFLFWTRAGGGS